MSRTLIIPDIHADIDRAEAIICKHGTGCDRAVLLGDYFDAFNDTPADAERVAKWLVKSVQDPRRVHLVGNHDLPYLGGEATAETFMCRGWSIEKHDAARPILQDLDLPQLHAAVNCDGWLVSHAGFYSPYLEGRTMGQLLAICQEALARAFGGTFDPLFAPSRARGFGDHVGGLTWLDWSREFFPVPGWHQIVGHTPSRKVRAVYSSATVNGNWEFEQEPVAPRIRDRTDFLSMNWCVDTVLRSACIVDGSTFELVWL